jgi:hypothetical protein
MTAGEHRRDRADPAQEAPTSTVRRGCESEISGGGRPVGFRPRRLRGGTGAADGSPGRAPRQPADGIPVLSPRRHPSPPLCATNARNGQTPSHASGSGRTLVRCPYPKIISAPAARAVPHREPRFTKTSSSGRPCPWKISPRRSASNDSPASTPMTAARSKKSGESHTTPRAATPGPCASPKTPDRTLVPDHGAVQRKHLAGGLRPGRTAGRSSGNADLIPVCTVCTTKRHAEMVDLVGYRFCLGGVGSMGVAVMSSRSMTSWSGVPGSAA